MENKSKEITNVTDLLEILFDFWRQIDFHHHIRLWYRGQSDDDWELRPGVYRESFNVSSEQERLEKEQQMTQDFKVQSASLFSENKSDEELYFLQQHYKMPTRLLDWSYTPLNALYFAVCNDIDKNGALFMMDAYQLAKSQNANADENNGFRGTPTSKFPLFIKAIQTISHWKNIDTFPKHILPIRPYYTDKRIILQKSCFTFHVPGKDILTLEHNSSLRKYIIPKDKKSGIRRELSLLGINDFTTYGDMEALARTLILNHDKKNNRMF